MHIRPLTVGGATMAVRGHLECLTASIVPHLCYYRSSPSPIMAKALLASSDDELKVAFTQQ